ncbi:MAG: thioredoxin family protein [Planctomycetes bacterium]|nr:thioredoxin family protein [Planctomycetota bacterium]
MRSRLICSLALASLLFAPLLAAQTDEPIPPTPKGPEEPAPKTSEKPSEGIKFLTDFAAAKKLAEEQKKGLFIDFMAEWCGPCKMLDKDVWSDKGVAERVSRDYVPVKIDVDEQQELAASYEIMAMPTLIIADAQGNAKVRQVGAAFDNPKDALKWFDDIAVALKELPEAEKAFAESKNSDIAKGMKLAEVYGKLGLNSKASKVCEDLINGREEKDSTLVDVRIKLADLQLEEGDSSAALGQLKIALGLLAKDDKRQVDVKLKLMDCRMYEQETEGLQVEIEALYAELLKAKDERVLDAGMKWVQLVVWGSSSEDVDEKVTVENHKKARGLFLDCVKALEGSKRKVEGQFYAAYFGWEAGEKDAAKKEMQAVIEAKDAKWSKIATDVLKQWENPEGEEKEGAEGDEG